MTGFLMKFVNALLMMEKDQTGLISQFQFSNKRVILVIISSVSLINFVCKMPKYKNRVTFDQTYLYILGFVEINQ